MYEHKIDLINPPISLTFALNIMQIHHCKFYELLPFNLVRRIYK
jgi:hypothetical protein